MRPVVFVDTSAFHALQNSGDRLEHPTAAQIALDLSNQAAVLVTTDYVLDESCTLLRSVLGHRAAVAFGRAMHAGDIEVVQVDETIQLEAWKIFERHGDKGYSFTDCTSFAVMKNGRLRKAFTFDRHFQQFGFETLPARLSARRK